MQLTHDFTVPAGVEETWAAFNDIAGVAECFPGATVTDVSGDSFEGTVKVRLGPIALLYHGSGEFTEKDDSAHRMVIAAKGKDKRGNGTAGADVTATFTDAGGSTQVSVLTDLSVTGKPAQFGRGVMQDVSDKLLQQFIDCLEQKLGSGGSAGAAAPAGSAGTPIGDSVAAGMPGGGPSGSAGDQAASERSTAHSDDAVDLGATVLPVIVRNYGMQIAAGLGVLLVLRWIVRGFGG